LIEGRRRYVALGSSFAAGLGLGPRIAGSPIACQRSANGYPQQLARLCRLSIDDRSCSGATVAHVIGSGRFREAPQVDALDAATELVTLSIGGNDVGYVGDLTMLAMRRRHAWLRPFLKLFWKDPRPAAARDFDRLQGDLLALLAEVRRRAPGARIVVVSYPRILPPTGTNAAVGLDESEAALMREVASRLDAVTRTAAETAQAVFVDMAAISADHHAGSAEPWVHGAAPREGVAFHPTLAGAAATTRAVAQILG
jgi:lysophospholipase L1-like esterase